MKWFALFVVVFVLAQVFGRPLGNTDTALEAMAQVPQWHCMRYRKFELIRRCRGYKNGIRKS
ncbi:hypothetical protein RN001_014737 [Aquatica leii]|uniref:Uncharacterized protein n=1 Tax=Aquatica leii TaxID=1421715 RepID=A0AAN7P0Y7_9COLE|nr:hypothetical protein RN001_014737 [Aquatica leii]